MKEPEKYGFDPKHLLGQLSDIYIHLNCDEFARAVAADEVSAVNAYFHLGSGCLFQAMQYCWKQAEVRESGVGLGGEGDVRYEK